MAKVELKQPIVQAIAEDVKDAASVVLVDYRGLTVAQDTELRKQLREAGITYKVYKNTMMKERSKEQILLFWMSIWKARVRSLCPKMMQQHRQEFSANLQKTQRPWS